METTYSEGLLAHFAEAIGVVYSTFQDYQRVSRAYDRMSARADTLSWRHHRVVAARDDRLAWLAAAREHEWSVSAMKAAIRQSEIKPRCIQA